MYLLFTDPHFDDQKANEYRWSVFDEIKCACDGMPGISHVFCLGDMTDKRDRFSREMVNRLVSCWQSLPVRSSIIMGNHDAPVTGGPAFWSFLSQIEGIQYVTTPTLFSTNLLLLPFSPNPMVEWAGIEMRRYKSIFLHATVTGAIAENGFELSGQELPKLPRSAKIYSGDMHNAQTVKNITYVGAPHPVKFGDHYPCRFLLLDERTFDIVDVIKLFPIGKKVVEISTLADLRRSVVKEGDQVRIQASVEPGSLDWGSFEAEVDRWAKEAGVEVMSIEGSYELQAQSVGQASVELPPEELLRAFSTEEGISDDLLDLGLGLLREVR